MSNGKEFERSKCCMFFGTWMETAEEIESDFGKEVKCDFYDAILKFSLFGTEPELKGALKYAWPQIKDQINQSIEHRSKGFSKEDTGLTNKITEYKKTNPEASNRQIAEACDCSYGKVQKVVKSLSEAAEATENTAGGKDIDIVNSLSIQACGKIIEAYKAKQSYNDIKLNFNLPYVNKELIQKINEKLQKEQEEVTERIIYAQLDKQEELNRQLKEAEQRRIARYGK